MSDRPQPPSSSTGKDASTRTIPFHRPSIGPAERDAVLEVLDSRWLTTGQRAVAFEEAVRNRVGSAHAVAVNSATAALHLILEALGIHAGDEVIVPTYTFAACGEVVRYMDARPRLADVDAATLDLTVETIEPQLRPETRAIMVVHYGGRLAAMEPILELAQARGLAVIEDAAHALPCSRSGRAAGTWGIAGALSFYATKTITTGEGGMLVTDSSEIADRARLMRLHGMSRDAWKRYSTGGSWYYEIEDAGFKYNLTDLAAAIGLAQLDRAEAMRLERERVARRYGQAIEAAGLGDLVELPAAPDPGEVHAWHLYPLRLNLDRVGLSRAETIDRLGQARIGTSVHFIPLHLHPYYRRTYGYTPQALPVAAREYEREISMPIYPDLSDADVDYVVERLAGILRPR
jgi:dTDP-4-amino-4,6-dideoxygalactose transaminase